MPRPAKHVFICSQARPPGHPRGSCGEKGSPAVIQEFMQQFEQRQLWGQIAFTTCGCLGTCNMGPSVLVYPEGVMYGKVTKEDVPVIIDEHLLGDKPVERLQVPPFVWG